MSKARLGRKRASAQVTSDDTPSAPEEAAQGWHEGHHWPLLDGKCWCCCRSCKAGLNPHYRAASRAAVADVFERIAAADTNNRKQPPDDGIGPRTTRRRTRTGAAVGEPTTSDAPARQNGRHEQEPRHRRSTRDDP